MIRHSHDQYNVDLCNNVCDICPIEFLRSLGGAYIKVMAQPRVFIPIPEWYESDHVNGCFDIEHGRNHLITGQ
jgi:hypothetical protein